MLSLRNILALFFIIILIVLVMIVQNNDNPVSRQLNDSTQVVLGTSRLKNYPTDNLETLNTPLENIIIETKEVPLENATREVVTGDTIRVAYRGWRATDGFVFDESFRRGDEGFTFIVGSGVIEGWSEGVIGMKVGEVRRLKIPFAKGYGEFGAGSDIPPSTDLIFDVELIEIVN